MSQSQDERKRERRELRAIAISVLFLIIGLVVIWLTKSVVNVEGDAVFISLLLIPVLVYMIISGRLKELKGPGGLEAKFEAAATASINAASETIEPSVEDMQIVVKEGVRALQRRKQALDETRPIVMTIVLGKGASYYDSHAVQQYLNSLSQFRNFKFVVFVDQEDRFVAYMPMWAVKGLLSLPDLAYEFISVINEGRTQDLHRYPGVVKETISTRATNAEALREMEKQNLEALVVIDENRQLKGVVEREQVLSRMLLALVK